MSEVQAERAGKTGKGAKHGKGGKNAKNDYSDGLEEKVVNLTRVSKVTKGGRTFSFGSLTVVGDPKKSILGVGRGKAKEVPGAIQKGLEDARRNTRPVELNGDTLWYPMEGHHGATKVIINPASQGTGIIAGGPMRAVFEVIGIKNVLAKVIGSTNPINVVYATVKALTSVRSPQQLAAMRGKTVDEIWDES